MQALLLDFDGVLVETACAKFEVFCQVADSLRPGSSKKLAYALSRELLGAERQVVAQWYGHHFAEENNQAKLILAKEFLRQTVIALNELKERTKVRADFRQLASEFFACFDLYIVSAAPYQDICQILASSEINPSSFRKIFAQEDGNKVAAIRSILTETSYSPADCLMVGDMPSDQNAAEQCGVPFIRFIPESAFQLTWPQVVNSDSVHDFYELQTRINR